MPALIIRLVDASRRHALIVTAVLLALAVVGGFYSAAHISIDTDINKLINPNLPWRQLEKEFEQAFPQNVDLLAIVIDAKTPDQAADATAALAEKLASEKTVFRTVRRPDGGRFFQQNGLLFLSQPDVQDFSDQIIQAQPLIGTLAADPSLRGVFTALDLAAQGVTQGALDAKDLDAPLNAVAEATEASLAGRHEPLSWQTLFTNRK